ncbi:hypothetical protein KEM56_004319 [Ascosphaera pollenicola]|nr:hypothetical protein KEM56_004319 [Ascosphaera pollenicola]
MADEAVQAMRARSLRSIRTELEFLTDTAVISQQQLTSILSNLPEIPDFSRSTSSNNGPNVRSLAAAANSNSHLLK